MFNVGGGEVIVILLVALLVLGPEKLPDAARKVGNVVHELRRMSAGFQEEVRAAMDQPVRAVNDIVVAPGLPAEAPAAADADAPAPADTPPARHLEAVDDDDIRPVDPTGRSDDPAA